MRELVSRVLLLARPGVSLSPLSATLALADEAVEKLVEHDFIVLELH